MLRVFQRVQQGPWPRRLLLASTMRPKCQNGTGGPPIRSLRSRIVTPAGYPGLLEFHFFDIQSTLKNSLCQHQLSHRNALFQLNNEILLVRSRSALIVQCTRKTSGSIPCPSMSHNVNPLDTTKRQAEISQQGPLNPDLQSQSCSRGYGSIFADFPFVMFAVDLPFFILWIAGCQPWRPDAIVDTIRVQLNFSFGFSRTVGKASDTSKDKVLDQPIKPISRQSEITEKCCQQDKTTLPGAPTCSIKFPYATAR